VARRRPASPGANPTPSASRSRRRQAWSRRR
jgi:hypothetical protein